MHNLFFGLAIIAIFNSACTNKTEKGSPANPIQISLVPSKDTQVLLLGAREMGQWLEKETGYKFEVSIPTSYIAVVEGIGGKRVDIAYLNTMTYFLAKDKYGAEAKYVTLNVDGHSTYKGQIITRADSKIKKLQDINGKKMAYVDPTSASGYIMPAFLLKSKNIKPSNVVFAGRHDAVVTMVYQKQVDAGATFYALPQKGKFMDARQLVLTQFPDVEKKIKVLDYTVSLMNDAFVFRKDLPPDVKEKLLKAMDKWAASTEGQATLKTMGNASGLRRVSEDEYLESKKILEEMKASIK